MRMFKQAIAVAALTAAFAAPSYGQTGIGNVWSGSIPAPTARSDERASAVIRVIDGDPRGGSAVAVDSAELARARASGEIQATEGTSAHVIERIRPRAEQAAITDAREDARTATAPTRAELQATARFDDVARSREHARYEADKRKRDTAQAREMQARAVEIQRSRASGEQRAQISWSAAEQPIVRVNPPAAPAE
jgi:hypothetical protein